MLRDLIEPFMLRRLKKDVKEVSRMPGKTEHVLFCRLSQRQRDMYEAYLKSEDVSRVIRGNNQLLGALTMLRKISNHPDLVCDPSEASFQSFIQNGGSQIQPLGEDSDDDSEEEILDEESLMQRSGKLEVLSKVLPLWHKQGHRVLIFCQWRKMLNIIQRFVMLKGWKFARLDGNTNIASRQHLVDSFNNDDSYFGMLCTTRTGGVGVRIRRSCLLILRNFASTHVIVLLSSPSVEFDGSQPHPYLRPRFQSIGRCTGPRKIMEVWAGMHGESLYTDTALYSLVFGVRLCVLCCAHLTVSLVFCML